MGKNYLNCWEFHKCGRGPDGKKVSELGPCPAANDSSFNQINDGKNGGRICWAVAGTFCGGKIQGTFAEKRSTCLNCNFFKKVRSEEEEPGKRTKFLRFLSINGKNSLMKQMTYTHIKAGVQFITQGEVENIAYIIEYGTCLVIVERDGEVYPVNHYGKGDIVGGAGLITGEPRLASVEAETDMGLWVLRKDQLDKISENDPEILKFITELVADRFDSRRPTAYRTIGKYEATEIIGRGAFSIVYKGKNLDLGIPVVIKMMRHHMAMDYEFLNNFRTEAKIIARLDHPNIIRVYDFEERYKTVFIIMALAEGESLKDVLDHLKIISPDLVAYYLVQICAGLEYAHNKGIIHRDINLSNIMVNRDDQIKILDFGLACPIGTKDLNDTGTVFYMAPEQLEGNPVDQRTDIYALGITAYEIATGKKPFPNEDIKSIMDIHTNGDIPDPSEINPGLPEPLRRFIVKSTRRLPSERYQSATEAMAELLPLVRQEGSRYIQKEGGKKHISTMFLFYNDKQEAELNKILQEFSTRIKNLGIQIKVSEIIDTDIK